MNSINLVLAGGNGARLRPLTIDTPKPLVRFGSGGAIIDYALYNCLVSGGDETFVLSQDFADMVEKYLCFYWKQPFYAANKRLINLPATKTKKGRYSGTADAVFQALTSWKDLPEYVVVLPGDHVYRMNYKHLLNYHASHGKACTISAVTSSPDDGNELSIIDTDAHGSVIKFVRNSTLPQQPNGYYPNPFRSMGIYVFTTKDLLRYLRTNQNEQSHEFELDILPQMAKDQNVAVFHYHGSNGAPPYWRDVGTLFSFWQAHMDLLERWDEQMLYTPFPEMGQLPFQKSEIIEKFESSDCRITKSAISETAKIGKATIESSIIGPGVFICDGAVIRNCVLLDLSFIHQGVELTDRIVAPMAEVIGKGWGSLAVRDDFHSNAYYQPFQ